MNETEKTSFWATLPGILTALSALLTAVGGLVVALSNAGVIDFKKDKTTTASITPASTPTQLVDKGDSGHSALIEEQQVAKLKDSGKKHFDSGEYMNAVSDFETALNLSPEDAWTLRYLADSYRKSGQTQLALTTINHSILLDSGNSYSYKVRGLLFYEAQQYQKAAQDFEKAIKVEPNNVWLIAHLSDAHQNKGDYKLALDYINKAIALDENDAFSYKVRGQIYYKIDRYDDAIADFKTVLKIEPNNTWSIEYIQKANEKINSGKSSKAPIQRWFG